MKLNKKGNIIIDMIMFIIVIFVVILVSIFGWKAFSDLYPTISADVTLNESQAALDQVNDRYPSVFDGLIIFILGGMWAAGIVAAYMSEQHPMIFGFMMIIIVFVLIAGAMIANFYEGLFQDSDLNTLTSDFPKSNFVMLHFLEISLVVVITIVMAWLGKNRI